MATSFPCPFLAADVELTADRRRHIVERHPEIVDRGIERLGDVLLWPDCIRASVRDPEVLLFSRWYDDLLMGKHLIVVVSAKAGDGRRARILTAYAARALGLGEVRWHRS